MLEWLRRRLKPPNKPVEEQLELPFDPPLPHYPVKKHSRQENL
jgi:hypothetical protein